MRTTYDEATGLPSRECVEQLARALALDEKSDLVVGVIALEGAADGPIDKSDTRLADLAQRLRLCLRSDDVLARLDADQFVLMMTPRIGREEEAQLLARLRDSAVDAQLRIGIAYCPEDGTRLDQLLTAADRRLHADRR